MTATERRAKTDSTLRAIGGRILTMRLSPEANAALDTIAPASADVRPVIERLLIEAAGK